MHVCSQSCLALCDPMNYSLPGSSVHGTILARILEWVAKVNVSMNGNFPFLNVFLTEEKLPYYVVLVSVEQQCKSSHNYT